MYYYINLCTKNYINIAVAAVATVTGIAVAAALATGGDGNCSI